MLMDNAAPSLRERLQAFIGAAKQRDSVKPPLAILYGFYAGIGAVESLWMAAWGLWFYRNDVHLLRFLHEHLSLLFSLCLIGPWPLGAWVGWHIGELVERSAQNARCWAHPLLFSVTFLPLICAVMVPVLAFHDTRMMALTMLALSGLLPTVLCVAMRLSGWPRQSPPE